MLATLLPVLLIATVVLGPALGSFFAALVVRENAIFRGKYGARSECDQCGYTLAWYDLIPLLSFLMLRGKCRKCGKQIAWNILTAEILGLLLYSILAIGLWRMLESGAETRDILVMLLTHGAVLTMLLYLAVYDIFTMSVPARFTQRAALTAIAINIAFVIVRLINPGLFVQVNLGYLDNLLMGVVAGGLIFSIIHLTKSKGMGQGDVFIAVIIGLVLGWSEAVSAFYVMVFSGALVGIIFALKQKKFHGLQIPLVPFMVLGYVIALAFGLQIFQFLFITI
jgi:prepilin signal peptidase PulO-like enzyme (type II secretory pathway)